MLNLYSCGKASNEEKTNEVAEASQVPSIHFWLGTYTSSPEQGIHLISFNPNNYQFDSLLLESDINNPSFVITNKKGDLIISVQEEGGEEGGSVRSFKYDSSKNETKLISTSSTLGSGPCYVTLSPDESYVLAGNYGSGDLVAIPIDQDGNLDKAAQEIKHTGSGVNKDRQSSPHVHSLVFHPNGEQVFVSDLGTDKVNIYDFDPSQEQPLSPSSPAFFEVKSGSGPRHLVFNKNGKKIYLIHEMTSEVGLYDYDMENGKITNVDTYPLTPQGFSGAKGAAEIRLSKDGKFLYASNRGDSNEIIGFKVDPSTGTLSKIQTISSGGETPRNFALSDDGKFLFAANQNSNTILAYERNPDSGIIKQVGNAFTIHKPVYFFLTK
ncbi:lactonase family protein [Echinicola sp. 20G]|uniref:lactonase family protein n=1 Tax=Echinicola sp. 20G TaxID=2781961 RepID=UPI0019107E8A|nr:lactonase family protein [Echinicola sp. 20G]